MLKKFTIKKVVKDKGQKNNRREITQPTKGSDDRNSEEEDGSGGGKESGRVRCHQLGGR